MNYSNELKVGIAIVVSLIIIFLGTRFFEDIPLFKGTYNLNTEFSDARGMIKGNAVRISGVKVGSVLEVSLNPETHNVAIKMRLNSGARVPEGSHTEITGIDALGAVQMVIVPGQSSTLLVDGDFIPGNEEGDILTSLTDKAPVLVNQVDSILVGLDQTLSHTEGLMSPGSDLRMLLTSLKGSAQSVEGLLKAERGRLVSIMTHVDSLSGSLSGISATAGDSLAQISGNLNQLLTRVDSNMVQLESTLTSIDSIVGKIDRGEGTVGLLINDESLYYTMDSTLTNINSLVVDIQNNPVKYMRALRLVDIF